MYQDAIQKVFLGWLVLQTLLLSGCATRLNHDWYEGDDNAAALLISGETVLIESINGKQTDSAFIGQIHQYRVAPGDYTVVAIYADIFDKTADDFEKIKSNPVKLRFSLEPGKSYRVEHQVIDQLEEAEAFAARPVFKVVDINSGTALAATTEYTTTKSLLSKLKFESAQQPVFASEYGEQKMPVDKMVKTQTVSDHSSSLKMLKLSWQQATPEERALFLKWVDGQ